MLRSNIHPREIFERSEELGLQNSANMLTEIIESDVDDDKRKEAIDYLALMSRDSSLIEGCFNTFENLLISDDKVEIKCEAAKALGRIKDEKGLKPLKWMLEQKEDDIRIKSSVLKAIYKIRFEEPEIQLFINELGSPYPSIKELVKFKLLSLNPKELVSILLKSLKSNNLSNQHKAEIVNLIGEELSSINISIDDRSYISSKHPDIITDLIQNKQLLLESITLNLRDAEANLLNAAITILRMLGKEVEQDLMKLMLSDDFIVRKNAIVLAGKLKLKNSVNLLLTNLDNIYHEVSVAAIESLGETGELSAIPDLLGILDIEDISFEYADLDMKLYIIDAIKQIYLQNPGVSFEYLHDKAKGSNATIKESIAFIYGELGKEEFVDPLIKLIEDDNLDVKKNSIIALGKIGSIKSLDNLIKTLEDPNSYWLIKKVAIDAIFNIYQHNWYLLKDGRTELSRYLNKDIAALIEYLKLSEKEDCKVKLSLIKFLEMFGGKLALPALLKRVNDFHRIVRIHASNAIKKIEEKLKLEEKTSN
jgi:HEAT repeat protein